MEKYPKIYNVFKRSEDGKFLTQSFSDPVFKFLFNTPWIMEEKIDGMNIRAHWNDEERRVSFAGRTDRAILPQDLFDRLDQLFDPDTLSEKDISTMTFYGEGYGAGIQKGGKYNPDGKDFILFDIMIGGKFVSRRVVEDIAAAINLDVVPVMGTGTIDEAISLVSDDNFYSSFGQFHAEGVVLKPPVSLYDYSGNRIIAKVKRRDFVK